MNKNTRNALGVLGGTSALVGVIYGVCCLADEVLFNRNLVPSAEISQKISGCDNSHLGEFLENNLKWVENYGYEKHYITSDRGEKLTGYLMKAKAESEFYVFCAHGYRSYGKKEFCGVAQYYLKRGINVFFPDHVASGESEGTHCTFGYHESADSLKWLEYINETFGDRVKLILHGVSMGSATVMLMSSMSSLPKNVKAIVADCGFSTATELFDFKLKALGVSRGGLLIKGVNFANKRRLGFDFEKLRPVSVVKYTKLPMFFIHGEKDALVPCYMVKELYEACGSEHKELLVVKGADHAQSYMIGKEEYERKMDAFLEKHVL